MRPGRPARYRLRDLPVRDVVVTDGRRRLPRRRDRTDPGRARYRGLQGVQHAGPFPTELHDEIGNLIRERGREYGTTTGRPRRTGWFDGVAARHVARLNGVTEIALTLVDVLDAFDSMLICTAYELDGQRISHVPAQIGVMARVKPIYERHPGWLQDSTEARSASDLPPGMLDYVRAIECATGAPVTMLGVGPSREQLVPISERAAMVAAGVA
jgi:adenylosuccinate synthase